METMFLKTSSIYFLLALSMKLDRVTSEDNYQVQRVFPWPVHALV